MNFLSLLKLTWTFLVIAVMAGCSRGSDKTGPAKMPVDSEMPAVVVSAEPGTKDVKKKSKPGEMYAGAEKIDKADFVDGCNDKTREKMFFVTLKFDELADKYKELLEENKSGKVANIFMLGPVVVRQLPDYTPSSKWEFEASSWNDAYNFLTRKQGLTAKQFLSLGRYVQRLLMNETKRRVDYNNIYFRLESLDFYKSALKKTEACLADQNCLSLNLTEGERTELSRYWWYGRKLQAISESTNLADNRILIEKIRKGLINNLLDRDFEAYKAVRRISPTTLELSLDAGNLKGHERELTKVIEDSWKSEKLSVKVVWTTQEKNPEAFRIIFDKSSKKNASVSSKNKTLFLPAVITSTTLAHEIGHVLGFPDYYYEFFNAQNCTYEEWGRTDDLMSWGMKVIIPANRWKQLDEAYPYTQKK